ncbi:hypothetical protein PG991_000479 [Apiospora marii]|uniref:C2H2-type domain-containing protein n=1 Tax=Apiospora marii TaxID=335849 RepID=A0ABR1T283_9PEZI
MINNSESSSFAQSYRSQDSIAHLLVTDDNVHRDDSGSETNPVTRGHNDDTSKRETLLPKPKSMVKEGDHVYKLWLWEFLSVLVSLGCMVAIVVIAVISNQTPLAEWTPPIGINTVVSVLVTVSKAAMLLPISECISQIKWLYLTRQDRRLDSLSAFDDASKGPWGAMLFLRPSNVTSWPLLATLGAFLTLVAMGMDPFAQQTVTIRTVRVEHEAGSTISVVSSFDTGEPLWNSIPPGDDFQPTFIASRLQRAFVNGVYDLGSNFQYTCPSGNCTWPHFTSLAMCSSCRNVTDKTRVVAHQKVDHGGNLKENQSLDATFTTPGGLVLAISATEDTKTEVAGSAILDYYNITKVTEKLVSLAVVQLKNSYIGGNKTANEQPSGVWTATECALSWCAKTYGGVVISEGKLLPSYNITEMPLRPRSTMNSTRGPENQIMWNLVPRIDGNTEAGTDAFSPLQNGSFTVVYRDHDILSKLMRKMFSFDKRSGFADSSIGSVLGHGTNASELVFNMTESMTNAIRSGPGFITAEGTAWREEAEIHIEWSWLILPLAFVLSGTALFAATVVVSSCQYPGQPLWKSSMWPLVFQGLDEWSVEERCAREDGSLREVKEMEEMAKAMRVTLQQNGSGAQKLKRAWYTHPLSSLHPQIHNRPHQPSLHASSPAPLLQAQERQHKVKMDHNPSGAQPAPARDLSEYDSLLEAIAEASQNLPSPAKRVVDVLTDYIKVSAAGDRTKFQNYHEFSLKPSEFNAMVHAGSLAGILRTYTHTCSYFPSLDRFTVFLYDPGYIYSSPPVIIAYRVKGLLQEALDAVASQSATPAHFVNASFGVGHSEEKGFENDGVQTTSMVNPSGVVTCSLPSPEQDFSVPFPVCRVHCGWSFPTCIDQFKAAMIEHSGQPRVTVLVNLAFNDRAPWPEDAISLDILHMSMEAGVPVVRHDVRGVDVRAQDPSATVGLCLSDFDEALPKQCVELRYGDLITAVDSSIHMHCYHDARYQFGVDDHTGGN